MHLDYLKKYLITSPENILIEVFYIISMSDKTQKFAFLEHQLKATLHIEEVY